MSILVGFSTIALVSLLILIIFYILCHHYSKLVCPTIIATQFKWVCDLLLYHSFSFPKHCCEHELPDMSEELNIVRYELMQGSSCEEEVECAVCLCNVEDGEEVRELRCNHIFHRVCLDRWVDYKHSICPLCRGSLLPRFTTVGNGESEIELLLFKFCSFSSRDREIWWLR